MTGRALAALFLAAALPALADEALDVRPMDEAVRPGRPSRFVVPDYPTDALAKGIIGYVDIEGRVSPLKDLKDVQYRAGTPEAEVFIPALKAVAGHWEFYPTFHDSCFPSDERVEMRVWFDIVEGKPKIDITVSKAAAKKLVPFRVLHCDPPDYPSGPLRAGLAAFVYASVAINPDGSVSKVDAQSYPRRRGVDRWFEEAVVRAYSRCQYQAAPETGPKRIACYQVFFRLAP